MYQAGSNRAVSERSNQVYRVVLSREEIHQVTLLTWELAQRYSTVEAAEFLLQAPVYAHELPRRLREGLNSYRMQELGGGICVVSGYPVDDEKIGKTPMHWRDKPVPSPSIKADIFFFLCSCLLGDPIGWSTQQTGYILHDILPIKGHETEQLGSGSEALLTWHTEDAFHPSRADYLGLICMRNPDRVETTYASIDEIELDREWVKILCEPRFTIRPDDSHLPKSHTGVPQGLRAPESLLQRSYERMVRLSERPEKLAVLFGDPESPYLRVDPSVMDPIEDDPEAAAAFEKLVEAVDQKITGIALQPGEIIFLDNYKVVHGRQPFTARYDGTDRWLRRLNVAADLRKSRDARISPEHRIIF
jgi:Fe(II)/alpha-ketoglutarate-dependent arginine beta-hydroxylase